MSGASAARRAYESVKEQVLSGVLPGGELLSEVEVAQQLEVSRTPVHEAFLRLETEGLLRLIPRRGAVVVPVSPREAADVLEVRRALETAAVRRLATETYAAERADLAGRLDQLIEEQRHQADVRDVRAFATLDEAFHRAIVTASGNALATGFYTTLGDRQRRMTVGAVGGRPDHLSVLVEEHRGLAELITAADPEAFDTALLTHLRTTHATFADQGAAR